MYQEKLSLFPEGNDNNYFFGILVSTNLDNLCG